MRWAHPGSIERWVAGARFGQDGDVGSEDNRILSAGGGRSGWRWWWCVVVPCGAELQWCGELRLFWKWQVM